MNSTKSRVIWGGRIMAAKISAEHARKQAVEAVREADRAEAQHGPLRTQGYGGPAPLRCEPLVGKTYDLHYADPCFGQPKSILAKNFFGASS